MDPECVALCDVLNAMPGVRTFESCCGHGIRPFRIWFEVDILDALRPLLNRIAPRSWTVGVRIASGTGAIVLCLEGPVHSAAGDELARCIALKPPSKDDYN